MPPQVDGALAAAVPEPASIALLAAGLVSLMTMCIDAEDELTGLHDNDEIWLKLVGVVARERPLF